VGKVAIVSVEVPEDRREWAREKDPGLESVGKVSERRHDPDGRSWKDGGVGEQTHCAKEGGDLGEAGAMQPSQGLQTLRLGSISGIRLS